jgi:hypothetical protein
MSARRIIFLEFNELCPSLLQQWMAEGRLPNFKKFYDNSETYTTESDEKLPPYLEPWIQWYSIHTGVGFQQHGVYHLTDGPKAKWNDVWRILLANGKTVANCGSMNARGFEARGSFFLPDPWCTTEEPSPSELGKFHKVVARTVQEYTNNGSGLSKADYARFLTFLASHGLQLKTVMAIVRQLMLDQVIDKGESWRRAVLLDRLQFDIFRHYFKRLKPDFSTFFLNSTAHYQHTYWRHMAPESFNATKPSEKERQRYGDAILFGYQQMDRLLGDFFKLESDGVLLMLATALSQQAFLKQDERGGQHFYRPHNMESLLESFGIRPQKILPVMTHQFLLSFRNEAEAKDARTKLEGITYRGRDVFDFAPSDPGTLYCGSQIYSEVAADAVVMLGDKGPTPFFDVFYAFHAVKSGCHHPDGVLWVKSGTRKEHTEKLSILEILPMLLKHYGVANEHRPEPASRASAAKAAIELEEPMKPAGSALGR